MLGDHKHCEEAKALGVDSMTVEDLKKMNKNKKLVKKLGERFGLCFVCLLRKQHFCSFCKYSFRLVGASMSTFPPWMLT